MEDKFLEGLKYNIGSALIYFPTEPTNLEELFERAQKIVFKRNANSTKIASTRSLRNFRLRESKQRGCLTD